MEKGNIFSKINLESEFWQLELHLDTTFISF